MKKEYALLLERLKSICGKDYKLFSVEELRGFAGTDVTCDEVVATVRRLDFGGYLDMRYCDGKEILIKPLEKPYSIEEETSTPTFKTDQTETRFRQVVPVMLAAFIGALFGGAIAAVAARLLC